MNSIHPAPPTDPPAIPPTDFWNALAPYHAAIEDNYFDRASLRRIAPQIQPPVLVVGGGHGLIVAELQKMGLQCDGVDFSTQMVRFAKARRGIDLVHADAGKMPFGNGSYSTVIFATGVVDFMSDEEAIKAALNEGKRVVKESGTIFVAFYKVSDAFEQFLTKAGLLRNHVLSQRESLENYLFTPLETLAWVTKKTGLNRVQAARLLIRTFALSTWKEKLMTFSLQRIFRRMDNPASFIKSASETQPYRNEFEIRNLFQRLAIPINDFRGFSTCYVVKLSPAN
jgi:ubiquinone/menaquinone biosynthesis C-methylase UbiE